MKVLKFGGTSVKDAESISQMVEIAAKELKEKETVVIVSSAMGGITNQLLRMAQNAEKGEDTKNDLQEIENRHLEVIRKLIPAKNQNPVIMQVKLYLNELEDLLQGVSAVKELSPKTQDSILSYGELCSNSMLAGIFSQTYARTHFLDARKIMVTDDHYGEAQLKMKETEQNILRYFKNSSSNLYCMTGFIASTAIGRTTTFGRGGSDYTAAIIAATLKVDEIQIWTDVDGFMTADPRIVKRAFSLAEISYTEARELSYFGAKVIYPPTMIPAFAKKIPIRIRNTFNPEFPGTVIHESPQKNGSLIRGISSIEDVSLVNIQGSSLIGDSGFSGRLFSLLSRHEINIIMITQASSEHSITFAISPSDEAKAKRVLLAEFEMELAAYKMEQPEIVNDLSVLAIVGENMRHKTGVSGDLFHALGRNGVNITAIAQGSSEYNISAVIDKKDLEKALNIVHEAFFLSPVKTLNVFYVGTGNIGETLLQQIKAHEKSLYDNNALHIKMIGLTNSRKMVFKPEGFEVADWETLFDEGGRPADLRIFVEKMKELNLPNSVFIDNSASQDIVAFYEGIFSSNISIVTCNKIGNSGPYNQYKRFKNAVKRNDVSFLYETNVGAGLPIINTLKDLLSSGDHIVKIEAILSGTISYIFNNFKGDKHFHTIVKEAQEKGFTEPDPRDDLSGLDFMRKMLILARDSGHALEMEDITIEGILPESCMSAPDVASFYHELEKADEHFEKIKKKAEKEEKVLRFIGVMENGNVRIELKAVDSSHPFYSLSGSDNIIAFTTNRYSSDYPLVVKGPGAGAEVTAGGVFADLVKVGSY